MTYFNFSSDVNDPSNGLFQNQCLTLQQELENERIQRKNESYTRQLELEEQKQSYEGEMTRVLAMYKQAEVLASTQHEIFA